MKVFIKTFGCRSNLYDTQIIKSVLNTTAQNEEEADIIIINSCTVTNFADRDLKRYINKHKDKKIILTGCAAYTQGEELYKEGRVKAVLGHRYKEEMDKYIDFEGVKLGDFDFVNTKIITDIATTKAFVKIQEGCDFECAYCIIPKVRGHSRSHKKEQILTQINLLAKNGISEFVLTGINMGSYNDHGYGLSDLIEDIIKIRGVKRIRLGSIEPNQVDEKLLKMLDSGVLEKHLHIALQHTSDKMLRIMKRRNRVKQTLGLFEKIASLGVALGSDIIVGHPGESEEVWAEALENFKKFPLTHIHVFRYSKRSGTLSAGMKNEVKGDIAKKRAKILDEIVKKNNYNFRMKKPPLLVHIENKKGEWFMGYDQFYNKALVKGDFIKGEWVMLKDYEVKEEANVKEK
ncbi:MAG: tRNA (N(6)-L-threonylcarbamoyladenosine(37)-C(2))-methylthiotransferase MtaB [Epsilonproteobacteria bacterium]|nr:tRNA (N(6)-L-threonylcarbamoyladenosine(37)-C(2))-methylthiotransferase MtaB [Campylobacterota bacterium]